MQKILERLAIRLLVNEYPIHVMYHDKKQQDNGVVVYNVLMCLGDLNDVLLARKSFIVEIKFQINEDNDVYVKKCIIEDARGYKYHINPYDFRRLVTNLAAMAYAELEGEVDD